MCEFTQRLDMSNIDNKKDFYLGKTGLGAVGGSPVGVGENGRET